MADTNPIYKTNPDVVLREEDPEGALLFNPDTNQIRVLNLTGLFIWKLLDGTKDLKSIKERVLEAFEAVPDESDEHISAFLNDIKAAEFITEV